MRRRNHPGHHGHILTSMHHDLGSTAWSWTRLLSNNAIDLTAVKRMCKHCIVPLKRRGNCLLSPPTYIPVPGLKASCVRVLGSYNWAGLIRKQLTGHGDVMLVHWAETYFCSHPLPTNNTNSEGTRLLIVLSGGETFWITVLWWSGISSPWLSAISDGRWHRSSATLHSWSNSFPHSCVLSSQSV